MSELHCATCSLVTVRRAVALTNRTAPRPDLGPDAFEVFDRHGNELDAYHVYFAYNGTVVEVDAYPGPRGFARELSKNPHWLRELSAAFK